MEKERYCELCGDAVEDLFHVVITFPLDLGLQIYSQGNFAHLHMHHFIICGCSSLWLGRNNRRHGRELVESKSSGETCGNNVGVYEDQGDSSSSEMKKHMAVPLPEAQDRSKSTLVHLSLMP